MKNILPKTIKEIIKIFNQNGYSCYLVGGCVRDFLINRTISEYDLCTDAEPNCIKKLFPKHIDIGEKFGCIKILYKESYFEVTTLRIDGKYLDFRHTDRVTFVKSPEIDSKRRDFTINALYYDGESLIDPFNYIHDIHNKLIRSIGNSNIKFSEDPLRILRCLRFKSQLKFKIDMLTLLGIKRNLNLITHISIDRISDELRKTFEGEDFISSLRLFNALSGFKIILNEDITIYNISNPFNLINKFHIKLFCLLYFHSNIKEVVKCINKNFKLTKNELKEINIIHESILNFKNNHTYIKRLIYKYDYNLTYLIVLIHSHYINKNSLSLFFKIKWGYSPIKISHLKINIFKTINTKKNATKYKNNLVTLIHKYPHLNEEKYLNHLIKQE